MDVHESDNEPLTTGLTPGKLLLAAREAKSLTQADISEQTRLSMQVIKDIENDHYKHIRAKIYLTGYLSSYAKRVGIPLDDIMQALSNVDQSQFHTKSAELPLSGPSSPVYSRSMKSKRSLLRWLSSIVLLVLIVMVVLWWQGQKSHKHSAAVLSKTTVTQETTTQNLPLKNTTSVTYQSPMQTYDKRSQIKPSYQVRKVSKN